MSYQPPYKQCYGSGLPAKPGTTVQTAAPLPRGLDARAQGASSGQGAL
jgi:hypothetical protein